jgi:hypothetical protein
VRSTRRVASQRSSPNSHAGAGSAGQTPAAWTHTSTPPSAPAVPSTAAAAPSSVVRSAPTATAPGSSAASFSAASRLAW